MQKKLALKNLVAKRDSQRPHIAVAKKRQVSAIIWRSTLSHTMRFCMNVGEKAIFSLCFGTHIGGSIFCLAHYSFPRRALGAIAKARSVLDLLGVDDQQRCGATLAPWVRDLLFS